MLTANPAFTSRDIYVRVKAQVVLEAIPKSRGDPQRAIPWLHERFHCALWHFPVLDLILSCWLKSFQNSDCGIIPHFIPTFSSRFLKTVTLHYIQTFPVWNFGERVLRNYSIYIQLITCVYVFVNLKTNWLSSDNDLASGDNGQCFRAYGWPVHLFCSSHRQTQNSHYNSNLAELTS